MAKKKVNPKYLRANGRRMTAKEKARVQRNEREGLTQEAEEEQVDEGVGLEDEPAAVSCSTHRSTVGELT